MAAILNETFQMHDLAWECLFYYYNIISSRSRGFNWQQVSIGSGNGFAKNQRWPNTMIYGVSGPQRVTQYTVRYMLEHIIEITHGNKSSYKLINMLCYRSHNLFLQNSLVTVISIVNGHLNLGTKVQCKHSKELITANWYGGQAYAPLLRRIYNTQCGNRK